MDYSGRLIPAIDTIAACLCPLSAAWLPAISNLPQAPSLYTYVRNRFWLKLLKSVFCDWKTRALYILKEFTEAKQWINTINRYNFIELSFSWTVPVTTFFCSNMLPQTLYINLCRLFVTPFVGVSSRRSVKQTPIVLYKCCDWYKCCVFVSVVIGERTVANRHFVIWKVLKVKCVNVVASGNTTSECMTSRQKYHSRCWCCG